MLRLRLAVEQPQRSHELPVVVTGLAHVYVDCDNVVVDLSRNRSKRFCEDGCGNRENVRAYRDRQRAD